MGLEQEIVRNGKAYAASLQRLHDDIKACAEALGLLIHTLSTANPPAGEIEAMDKRAGDALDAIGSAFGLLRDVLGE